MNVLHIRHSDARTEAALRNVLIFLNCFVSVAALGGGTALTVKPSGSLLGLNTSILGNSGFSDFRIPGVILVICVGLVPLAVAYWLWRRKNFALLMSMISSALLTGWILSETLLIRSLLPLHLFFMVIAILMLLLTIQIGYEDENWHKKYFEQD